ncbi:hypothetical protein U9J35_01590 [Rossellomorea aquimaris]|nr:hypothetical protein [Rossellomorea aquimaris]WRP06889.1 hypothetical protein U9J35_01590 [Rossellomorea aquimaris]
MKLFKGDIIKKVNKLMDNAEKRKEKLQGRIETLQGEVNHLYQAKQDDFSKAVLEGGEPSKKLANDLVKAQDELREAHEQLSLIDGAVKHELEKAKADVDKERRQFVADKGEDFKELFERMNKSKIEYLETVIEYKKKHGEFDREYWRMFRDIEQRVGLRGIDPREHHKVMFTQRHQVDGRYTPAITPEEHRDAFMEGKLSFEIEKNKDIFKK